MVQVMFGILRETDGSRQTYFTVRNRKQFTSAYQVPEEECFLNSLYSRSLMLRSLLSDSCACQQELIAEVPLILLDNEGEW